MQRAAGTGVAIEYEDVTKTFGDVTAVDEISFEVEDGELLALLGPSGSGKTTTLRMLAGFETPTNGTISLAGDDVTASRRTNATPGWCFKTTRCSRT